MIYHYCRVSSKDQKLERQLAALAEYKQADQVFSDKQSGKNFDRTEYQAMKKLVVAGDEVIIKELDRLGRNKEEVKDELRYFKNKGVIVRMLDIPTTLSDFPGQEWVQDMINSVLIEVIGAMAEQERIKIRARQAEGIAIAKANGRYANVGGSKPKQIDKFKLADVYNKWAGKQITTKQAIEVLEVSRATFYKRIKDLRT